MDKREISAAAAEFEVAQARGEFFPTAWFDRLALDDAYRILLARIARHRGAGARRIGWKVGLTSSAIQQQFGLHEPVFGCLLADGLVHTGHIFRRDALIGPGFENELCIVLDRDLPLDATRSYIAAAVERACIPHSRLLKRAATCAGNLLWRSPITGSKRRSFWGHR